MKLLCEPFDTFEKYPALPTVYNMYNIALSPRSHTYAYYSSNFPGCIVSIDLMHKYILLSSRLMASVNFLRFLLLADNRTPNKVRSINFSLPTTLCRLYTSLREGSIEGLCSIGFVCCVD